MGTRQANAIGGRLDAATGVLFVVLMTMALLLPGQPPKAEDPVETITAVLVDRRGAFLVGGYLAGLATMAYLWFLGSVREYLHGRGGHGSASAATAGGVFAITAMLVGMLMFSGVAFVAARLGEQAVVRAMTDIGNSVIEVSKFGFAVFVLGVLRAARGNGGLPRWLVRLGLVAVPALLVSAVALFVDRGPFQFGGVIDLGGSVPALLLILGLSFVMMRARPRTVATP